MPKFEGIEVNSASQYMCRYIIQLPIMERYVHDTEYNKITFYILPYSRSLKNDFIVINNDTITQKNMAVANYIYRKYLNNKLHYEEDYDGKRLKSY